MIARAPHNVFHHKSRQTQILNMIIRKISIRIEISVSQKYQYVGGAKEEAPQRKTI